MNKLLASHMRWVFLGLSITTIVLAIVLITMVARSQQQAAVTPSVSPRVRITSLYSPTPAPTLTPVVTPTPSLPADLDADFSSLRGKTVTLWAPFMGVRVGELLTLLAGEFNRDNPWGLRAEVTLQGSDLALANQLEAAWAGEEGAPDRPHAILAPPARLNAWLDAGRLTALDPYLTAGGTRLDDPPLEDYDEAFLTQDRFDGQQAGLPALRNAFGLLYNAGWAQELGFPNPPATLEDFQYQACAAALANNRSIYLAMKGTGGWLVDTSAETMLSWLHAFAVNGVPAEEGGAYHFNQGAGLDALTYLRDLQADGCAWISQDQPLDDFLDQQALFVSGSLRDLPALERMFEGRESDEAWAIIPYPAEDGEGFVYADGYSYGLLRGDPEDQLAGWLFIRWLSQASVQARLAEVFPSLPVSQTGAERMKLAPLTLPERLILGLNQTTILPAPSIPSWMIARRPLEDAGWQLFHLATAGQLADILPETDALITDLLAP